METARLVIAVDSSGAKSATRDLDRLTASAGKTAKSAIGLKGALVGAFVAAGVLAGINAIARATMEAEKAQAQLNAVLKSTKGAAGLTAAELNNMAGELQKVTTFGDEAIIGAQSMLLTFTKIGKDTFPQATEAVLDVATALGTDLKSASIQVGKALNDPILGVTALGRAGVQFSDDQKKVIKALVDTGRVADAQRIILSELETQMGGSARAARDTLGGALAGLHEAFGDLLEGDGHGVNDAKDAIEDLTAIMQSSETKAAFATMVGGLVDIGAAAAKALVEVINLTKFVAEEVAAIVHGPAGDDRPRLDDRLTRLKKDRKALSGGALSAGLAGAARGIGFTQTLAGTPLEGSSIDVLASLESNRARIDAEIKKTEALISALDSLPSPRPTKGGAASPTATGAVDTSGLDLRSDKEKSKADSDARRAAEEAIRLQEQRTEATADFILTTQRMRAELEGPIAEVNQQYAEREEDLIDLAKLAGLSNEELASSLDLLDEARQRDIEAIQKQLTPEQQFVDGLKFELEMMQLGNDEREREIALRQLGAEATAAQRDEVTQLIGAIQSEREAQARTAEATAQMDGVRREASRGIEDFIMGEKGALEALEDFGRAVLRMVAQRLADQLTESIFGAFGTSGQGSSGGDLFSSFFGMLFGGGKATGGRVDPSKGYMVGENGPEWFQPHAAGNIIPADRTARMGGGNTTINVNVPGTVDHRSASQIAKRVHEKQQMYASRFA